MKILRIIIFLVIVTFIVLWTPDSISFDEARWRKAVESQSVEKLYASHFADGKYFNPWMPRERGRLWHFLRWRLSRKSHYTAEEKAHKPKVISRLRERIDALRGKRILSHGSVIVPSLCVFRGNIGLPIPCFPNGPCFRKE